MIIKKLNNSKAFSLIELIMTIIIVSIVSIPLSMLVLRHIESVFESDFYITSINLARKAVEETYNIDFDDLENDSTVENGYNISRIVNFAFGDESSQESIKKITVNVSKSGDPQVLSSISIYRLNNFNYDL